MLCYHRLVDDDQRAGVRQVARRQRSRAERRKKEAAPYPGHGLESLRDFLRSLHQMNGYLHPSRSPSIHSVNARSVWVSEVGKGNPRFGRNILLLISKVKTIFTVSPATRFTFGFVTLE